MTKHEAKALSIEVWQYLADHPEHTKNDLPVSLQLVLKYCRDRCPLCELFHRVKEETWNSCPGCPLDISGEFCFNNDSAYKRWQDSYRWLDIDTRQQSAQRILGIIKAWDPEEKTL